MGISYLAINDKKGKEVFFDEAPTEVTFQQGILLKALNPTWNMKTEDWGYIQRAYDAVKKDASSYWKDYDIYFLILVVAGASGLLFIITGIIELIKFAKMKWRLACVVRIVCQIIGTCLRIPLFPGLFRRKCLHFAEDQYLILSHLLDKFYSDTKTFWTGCSCDTFQAAYFKSVLYYLIGVVAMLVVSLIALLHNICFRCKRPKPVVAAQI